MFQFDRSEEEQIQLLEFIISPKIPCSGNLKRVRSSPTKIKILYHLFQLSKKISSGEWEVIYQNLENLSKHSGVGKKHFSEFINSPEFSLFGKVQHRKGTTNLCGLKKWLIDLFYFLEKKGMMKFFRKNFEKWKEVFMRRLNKWLMPLIRSGLSLYQILMNKLSTRKILKGGDPKGLKGGAIKYSSSSYKAFQGSKSNTEQPLTLAAQNMCEVNRLLKDRFHIRDGDIYMLSNSFSLNHHKRAIKLGISWLKRGMLPTSPVRMYQTCLNKTRSKRI